MRQEGSGSTNQQHPTTIGGSTSSCAIVRRRQGEVEKNGETQMEKVLRQLAFIFCCAFRYEIDFKLHKYSDRMLMFPFGPIDQFMMYQNLESSEIQQDTEMARDPLRLILGYAGPSGVLPAVSTRICRHIGSVANSAAPTVIAAGVTVILVVDSMYNIPKEPRAIDGTHVRASVPIALQARFRGRKEGTTQNVLAVVSFDLKFMYVLAGWEGLAHDSRILDDAFSRPNGLRVPEGKYLLGDAGYELRNGFIPPYRGVRYHLKEYSNHSPENEKELFNLRHSSLRTTVERAFGVLKKRFRVLDAEPYWSYKTQVDIILACCVLHNHIMGVDPTDDITRDVERELHSETQGTQLIRRTQREEREENREWAIKRDAIANAMYNDYINRGNMLR
ncbi:hypothetical protein HHK36_013591 [Tetracentron sinense]|uniref:DDE Tnp4 domain-containing protein n=1 Tax=Tetracentron sinense TaxID=13715 RepID=A0A835DHH7_TETSI|nr:hypothetical protein HHK36_013591 [Tetracentron sinense]